MASWSYVRVCDPLLHDQGRTGRLDATLTCADRAMFTAKKTDRCPPVGAVLPVMPCRDAASVELLGYTPDTPSAPLAPRVVTHDEHLKMLLLFSHGFYLGEGTCRRNSKKEPTGEP